MEESILKLYEELDKEKYENSTMEQRRSLKIRQFVEKMAKYDPLEGSHKVQPNRRPFSCKFCDQSFLEVHEVKEHIKVHESISEVKDLRNQVKSLKTQVEELEAKLKSSQSKLAFETRRKETFKKKSKMELLASTHTFTLEGSRKKRKVQEEEVVHETTVSVHEEKKQKKMSESEEIIDPESEENAIFSQKASQKRHKETVHEIKKHFECKCGEQFSTKKSLRRHENSVHSEVKKVFQCEFCNFKVSRKDNFQNIFACYTGSRALSL